MSKFIEKERMQTILLENKELWAYMEKIEGMGGRDFELITLHLRVATSKCVELVLTNHESLTIVNNKSSKEIKRLNKIVSDLVKKIEALERKSENKNLEGFEQFEQISIK